MATPRNRQYRAGKGRIDLGSILLGVLGGAGTGEIEAIPQEDLSVPGFDYDERALEPTKFQVKSKSKDYTGRGQEQANRANIESIQAEESRKAGIRTKREEIPIKVEEEEALNPVRLKQINAIHDANLAAEVRKLKELGPIEAKQALDKLIAEHEANLEADIQKHHHLDPLVREHEEKLGAIKSKQKVGEERELSGIRTSQAEELAGTDVVANRGIIPNKESKRQYDEATRQAAISEALQRGFENIAKARLGTQEAEKGYKISVRNEPTDVEAAGEQSQFGLEKVKGARKIFPKIQAEEEKRLPLETEGMELDNLRKRLFGLSEGQGVYDVKYPGAPILSSPTAMERLRNHGVQSNIQAAPGFGTPQYETVVIDGQVVRRKKPPIAP